MSLGAEREPVSGRSGIAFHLDLPLLASLLGVLRHGNGQTPFLKLASTWSGFGENGSWMARRNLAEDTLHEANVAVIDVPLATLLARDDERVIIQGDLDVVFRDAGELGRDAELIARVLDVHVGLCEQQVIAVAVARARADHVAQQAVHELHRIQQRREGRVRNREREAGANERENMTMYSSD